MAGTSQVIKRLLSCHINSKILFSSIRSASNLESHLQAWQSTSACCKAIKLNYLHRIVVENCLNLSKSTWKFVIKWSTCCYDIYDYIHNWQCLKERIVLQIFSNAISPLTTSASTSPTWRSTCSTSRWRQARRCLNTPPLPRISFPSRQGLRKRPAVIITLEISLKTGGTRKYEGLWWIGYLPTVIFSWRLCSHCRCSSPACWPKLRSSLTPWPTLSLWMTSSLSARVTYSRM